MLRIYNARLITPAGLVQGELWVDQGRIIAPQLCAATEIDAQNQILSAGYIDLQINGAFGVDFAEEPHRVKEVATKLLAFGVTSFLATVVTTKKNCYPSIIAALQPQQFDDGADLLGVHLEGPFFNPTYKGAHARDLLRVLDAGETIEQFYGSLQGVKLITLAPELPNMLEQLPLLKSKSIVVALGHCAPSGSVISAAHHNGATLITHLFNAMPPFHHRVPGLISAALFDKNWHYSLICDGIHIGSHAVQLATQVHEKGLVLISDAMSGLGLPDGYYRLADEKVAIHKGRATIMGTDILAGSVCSLDLAVRHLHRLSGCSLSSAIESATLRPATLLGIEATSGTLNAGAAADFILLDDNLNVQATFLKGRKVWSKVI